MKFRIKQTIKMIMQHMVLPLAYFVNRWRRIDESFVVMADAHHDTCPPHLLLIRQELADAGFMVKDYFFDLAGMSSAKGFMKLIGFMKFYASAGTVIICDYFIPVASCRKKRGTRVIQMWHGAGAFKKFGYDAADDIPTMYRGNVHRNYSLVTVSGDACVQPFMSAMGIEDKDIVKPYGISITDRLYNAEYIKACREKFEKYYPEANGRRIVLWAPTFRGNAGNARLCGEAVMDSLAEKLGESDAYLVKSVHPHTKKAADRAYMDTEELMTVADVLITDYSSVFFNFLILDRPIIFFAPDYEEYSEDRGFYPDYDKLPGIVVRSADADTLQKSIEECMTEDKNAKLRNAFKIQYINGCDGHVTERIIDYVRREEDI